MIFIQHEDKKETSARTEAGRSSLLLSERIQIYSCINTPDDSFNETGLADILEKLGVQQLIVTGCATDFCVDTTVRAAASRNYEVVVVKDGHTTKEGRT